MRLENAGILHYDVPDEIRGLATRLRARLRRGRALLASKSVYIIHWSDEPGISQIIDDAKSAYAKKHPEKEGFVNHLQINAIKADDATAERLHQMAVSGLSALIGDLHLSLKKKLKKMSDEGETEMDEDIQKRMVKKIEEIEILAVSFRLMDDVGVALDAVRTAVVTQLSAEVAAKLAKKAKVAEPVAPLEQTEAK